MFIKSDKEQNLILGKTKFCLIYSVLINIIFLSFFLILFEVTPKSDDYDMANILYGGLNGKYSPFILYSHVFLGYLMVFLLNLFPGISWFFVLQCLAIFVSFVTIGYIVYCQNDKKIATIIMSIFLVFACYEFYIRLTFTKTAGVLLCAGLLFLFYLIENNKKSVLQYLWVFFLITVGLMVRNVLGNMILCIFVSCFIVTLIRGVRKKDRYFIRKSILFVLFAVVVFFEAKALAKIDTYIYNNDAEWGSYKSNNSTRSLLTDYGIPEYDTFADEYEKLGISKNDLHVWFDLADMDDPDILDYPMYSKIRSIYKYSEDTSSIDILNSALKGLFMYEKNNEMFYLFIVCVCAICFFNKSKEKYLICVVVGIFILIPYLYFCFMGRLRAQVDVCVTLCGSLILLGYLNVERNSDYKKISNYIMVSSVVVVLFISNFYNTISKSDFYGQDISSHNQFCEDNYQIYSLMSEDKESFYVIGAYETNASYWCFQPFSVIEPGFYSNIYRLNSRQWPSAWETVTQRGLEHLWPSMIENENIFYAATEICKDDVQALNEYMKSHYCNTSRCTLVKQMMGLYIYVFDSGELNLDTMSIDDNSRKVIRDINFDIQDKTMAINGYAYIENEDSFAANIYIEVIDNKSEDAVYYYTLQTLNTELEENDKMAGKYSAFDCQIDITEYKDYQVNIILDSNGVLYRIPLDLE